MNTNKSQEYTRATLTRVTRDYCYLYIYKKKTIICTLCKIIDIKKKFSLKSHSRFWQNNNAYSH